MSLTGFLIGRLIAEQELKGPTGQITNQAAVDRSAALGLAFGATPIGIIAVREFARNEAGAVAQPAPAQPVIIRTPRVVGLPPDEAIKELAKQDLQGIVENPLPAGTAARVARQSPEAGASTVKGNFVVLAVEQVTAENPNTNPNNSPV